ncbi:MAG: hypothetical protein IT559_02410 [Alphaproteobacteria bacterium]|nr:hypothetical protein [Alphaproteobacteria bacterium]
MINRFFAHSFIFFAVIFGASQGTAQESCNIDYEVRVDLRKPEFGAYNIYDTIYGRWDQDEIFKAVVPIEGGQTLMAVGEVYQRDKSQPKSKAMAGAHDLLLVQTGRNGRVLLDQIHHVEGLGAVVDALPHERGFAVFANQRNEAGRAVVWMGVFDPRGFMLDQQQVADSDAGLEVFNVVRDSSDGTYLLAASSLGGVSVTKASAVLYRIDQAGKVISRAAFVMGAENRISGIVPLEKGGAMAVGYSYDAAGRKNGWVARLNKKFGLVWQQVYPRGAAAELASGRVMPGGQALAVTGAAVPISEGRKAGWVMAVSTDNGAVIWQRFFSGALNFSGRDLLVSPDGVVSAILDGDAAQGSDEIPHIRLVTIRPRGAIFSAEAFYNGAAVDAFRLASGPKGERILVGTTLVPHQIGKPGSLEKSKDGLVNPEAGADLSMSQQGWMLVAPSAEGYKDPCAPLRAERSQN